MFLGEPLVGILAGNGDRVWGGTGVGTGAKALILQDAYRGPKGPLFHRNVRALFRGRFRRPFHGGFSIYRVLRPRFVVGALGFAFAGRTKASVPTGPAWAAYKVCNL